MPRARGARGGAKCSRGSAHGDTTCTLPLLRCISAVFYAVDTQAMYTLCRRARVVLYGLVMGLVMSLVITNNLVMPEGGAKERSKV